MGANPHYSSELSRELTLFQITMMGLGMMIGAGVFLGVGNAIYVAGSGGMLLTFLLNGVIAMFTACSYAELSSAFPQTGGAYNYARRGFGRGTSFVAGWMEWFASSVAGSLYSVTFAIYVVRYFEILGWLNWLPIGIPMCEKLVAVGVACAFFYINYRGASETGKVGAFFTLGQTLFLLFIGVVGIVVVLKDPERFQNFQPFLPNGWSKLLVTMGFTYVAFEGYEVIAQTGDEAIDPRKNLPKAMIYSVFIVTVTYVLVGFATVVAVKSGMPGISGPVWEWIGSFRERGFGEAIARLLPMGNLLLTLAVIFAATSALNSTIYSATRALYALGRDTMVPSFFAHVSRKTKTPWVALLATAVLVIIVATLLPTMDVASSASIMFLFLFFLVNVCVIRIRLNMGDELQYGFIMPFFPLFPVLAIVAQAVLAVWLIHMSVIAWIIAPLWILSGLGVYLFYSRHNAVAISDDIQILEEEKAVEKAEYNVMVSVANPKNAIEMVGTTYKICGAKNAHVELLHMVPVPDQVPLTDAEEYMIEGKEAIVEVMLYLEPLFPLSSTIRYCRNIARGIVSAVKEKRTDLLIMGWHGARRNALFSLGSTVDPIIERSPCDVVILKGVANQKFKRVLVPVAGGPNSQFALEIASILVDDKEGEITAFTVQSEKQKLDIDAFVKEHQSRLHISPDRVHTKSVHVVHVIDAVLTEAADYDLVVLGCSHKSLIYKVTQESIPEHIARECLKPLVFVNEAQGIHSWIRQWV